MNLSRPLLISLLCCSPALAQTAAPDDEHAADRAALRALGGQYEQAINSGDLRVLAPSVAPEASAVFATNDEVHGLDAMQKYFDSIKTRLGSGSSYTVKLDPDRTEFFGDIALAHGRSDETAKLGSGREYHFTTHWTAVLRNDSGRWKAQRLHVSMNPLDNPAITARLNARTWAVGACVLLAVVVGFWIGRTVRREGPEKPRDI
jgi:ketosteroid isomerase-like protein